MEKNRINHPPFLEGEKVIWHGGSPGLGNSVSVEEGIYKGKVCWIGKMKEFGNKWIIGVEMEKSMKGGTNGTWQKQHVFSCKSGHGFFVPAESLQKSSNSSDAGSMSATNEKGFFKLKDKKNLSAKEISKTSIQNGAGSPKFSPRKGGAIFSKDLNVNNSTNNGNHDAPIESLNSKKAGSSHSVKSVFGTMTKKEKKIQSPASQEIVLHNEDQSKSHRGGFLNIFKWFSKRDNQKQDKNLMDKMGGRGVGSTTSLVSDSSSITFFPIRHSVSADNSNTMMKSYDKSMIMVKGNQLQQGVVRRSSVVSTNSNVSLNSSSSRAKKRLAPRPPDSIFCGKIDSASDGDCGSPSTSRGENDGKVQNEEQFLYGKIKRKAPQPPTANKSPGSIKSYSSTTHSANNSMRPLSTFSNFSSISHSGSSTLQSSTCSENDSLTLKSDISHNTSSFPHNKDNKGPLSPKPWYKRKKVKDKSHKSKKEKVNNTYESWMPDIQYSRQNVNVADTRSLQDKNIETFFDGGPQVGQRFSILSSISDLDRAATEQFEREKAKKNASKIDKNATFYTNSSPHILCQKDLVPKSEEEQGAVGLSSDITTNSNKATTYDNLNYSNENNSLPVSYSTQPTLKLNHSERINNTKSLTPSAPDISLYDHSMEENETSKFCDATTKVNYDEYLEEIRKELEQETLENSPSLRTRSTPKEKAIFDPELFYQLAKDAKVNSDSKVSVSIKSVKESEVKPKENVSAVKDRSCYNFRLKSHKNFGFRMNNFFTPDVSTILEGSESVTSSNATTTPAEDFNDDFLNRSAYSTDIANDFMSINSDLNSEYKINTSDLQDIIESFALDLRRSDQEEHGGPSREGNRNDIRKTKADKIRDEVLLLREKDNFLMWQKRMQETELTKEDDETAIQERKKKWVCDSCTLINQPWRLHCEACGTLRLPNPKRIDEENASLNSPDAGSSLHSASNTSPVTVIHDDRICNDNLNDSLECDSRIHQGHSNRNSDTDVTPTLNWETELQSYFTQFDDHTNAIRRIDSGNKCQIARQNIRTEEDSNAYGRIFVSRNKVSEDGKSSSNNEQIHNIIMNGEDDVDMQEIRRARIRKFQLNYSSSQENQNLSSNPLRQYNDKERFGFGIQEKISQLSDLSSRSHQQREEPSSECSNQIQRLRDSTNVFRNDEEKQFYKNEYKKSPVLKPSGAVKNVVSIFNQLDQLKAVQEKPPPVKVNKRRSFSNILNFGDFERLISGTSNEVNANSNPLPRTTSPVMADIDIASAISKFDEMAALAEIENIKKPVPKIQKKWLKPKVFLHSENKEDANNKKAEESEDSGNVSNFNQTNAPVLLRTEIVTNGMKADNRDSCDSIIKDGFLYTTGEARRRSMSIGSGTFELMNAREFATIEAHHSRRPSPCEEFDSLSSSELSHPLLMPEILIPSGSYSEENYLGGKASDEHIETQVLDTNSGNAVERLSRQLTEVEGIETFKATLARDEPKLGEHNTKTISRLLRKLEYAIVNGQHEEASRLAHDLAKMRLECSVTNKAIKTEECLPSQHSNFSDVKKDSPRQEIGAACYSGDHQGAAFQLAEKDKDIVGVVKRTNKTQPFRREVKSDITNTSIINVIPQEIQEKEFCVKMYIEDKASHQGPIILELQAAMTVGDLKLKVSEEFGFPVEVQRWILGRLLADDDSRSLFNYKVTAEGCPIFLYLVAPDSDTKPTSPNMSMSRSSSYKSYPRNDRDSKIDETNHKAVVENVKEIIPSVNKKAEATSSPTIKQKIINQLKKDKGGKSTKVKSSQKLVTETKIPIKPNESPKIAPKNLKDNPFDNHSQLKNASRNSPSNINGWICPQCTLINHKDRPGCEACATERPETHSNDGQKKNLRQAVFALEAQGCVANQEPFDCLVCLSPFNEGEGVILRDCLHVFCRFCLTAAVKYSDTARVKCPFSNKSYSCQFSLQEREIKDLLNEEDYKKHLDKSVKEAAGSMRNVFYCMTPDCKGFCQIEDNVNVFLCSVCQKANCLTCQAQHGGETCKQYQDELSQKQDEDALKTKKFFDDIIRRGDGMPCPQCSIMLVRKWGCDWMRCPMCRTEICWVTRMPRWGPEGQGDTSGGCKCGLNGRKCHPKCTYCH